MKKVVIALFVIFLVWMLIGGYMLYTDKDNAQIVMGLGVFFMAFILMPVFIYSRYKEGRYKKYIITDEMINEWKENANK